MATVSASIRLTVLVACFAVAHSQPARASTSYEAALQLLAGQRPTKLLAVVPPTYAERQCDCPPDLSFADGLWWFGSEDASFVPWFDARERFVVLRPSRRAREWARGRDLLGWSAHEEDFTKQVHALLSALTEEETASVASGVQLAPVSLGPEGRAALVAMFGLGDMKPVAEAAVSDPLTRVRIDFAVSVGLQVEPAGPSGLPRMGRRATRLPRITVPPEGPAPAHEEGGTAPDPPGADTDARLTSRVDVAQPRTTVAALGDVITEASGLRVDAPPEVRDHSVVLSPGEWQCAELLDALSASCMLACRLDGDSVLLEDPKSRVPEALLAQLDVTGQWSTLAFGRADVESDEPKPVSDLTEGQRAWLERFLLSVLPAREDVEPRVTVLPEVTVTLEAWAALAPLPGADGDAPDAAPEYQLIIDYQQSATWFWERLPEGWP